MLIRAIKPSYFRIFTCARPLRNFCDEQNDVPKKTTLDVKDEKKMKTDQHAAAERLNQLLAAMSTKETVVLKKNVETPMLKKKNKKQEKVESSDSSDDEDQKPQNIFEAARKVAETIDGDKKQTEMELLSKLLGFPMEKQSESKTNLSHLISGMQITNLENEPIIKSDLSRAEFVRKTIRDYDDRQRQRNQQYPKERQEQRPRNTVTVKMSSKVDLFGAEPLGIFTPTKTVPTEYLETWDYLEKRELRLAVTHPPNNYFEKMAIWTEQGKLWRFPIDNEQDIGPESDVDFTEHIFLEEQLEPWCPKKGPVRHFMELVTVGLSKNPYLSVEEKHDHINYYKKYFESKKELLKQIIVDAKKEDPKEVSSQ